MDELYDSKREPTPPPLSHGMPSKHPTHTAPTPPPISRVSAESETAERGKGGGFEEPNTAAREVVAQEVCGEVEPYVDVGECESSPHPSRNPFLYVGWAKGPGDGGFGDDAEGL